MPLDLAQFLLKIVLFSFVYTIAVTTSGAFKAWIAYLCGDDTGEEAGFLTLNPLMHVDPIGFFCFYFLGLGWGQVVPINPRNIPNHFKLVIAYLSDSFMNIFVSIVALVLLVAAFGSEILQTTITYNEMRLSYPQFASFAFISMHILLTLIRLNVWLAALSGIRALFNLVVLIFFPQKQHDPDARFIISFGPLLLMILFLDKFMYGINMIIIHVGFVIASFLKLL